MQQFILMKRSYYFNEEEFENEDPRELEYTLSKDETYYIVPGIGTCTGGDIIIPEMYNGKPVTSIGLFAFDIVAV